MSLCTQKIKNAISPEWRDSKVFYCRYKSRCSTTELQKTCSSYGDHHYSRLEWTVDQWQTYKHNRYDGGFYFQLQEKKQKLFDLQYCCFRAKASGHWTLSENSLNQKQNLGKSSLLKANNYFQRKHSIFSKMKNVSLPLRRSYMYMACANCLHFHTVVFSIYGMTHFTVIFQKCRSRSLKYL